MFFVFEIFHFKQNFVIEKKSRDFFTWLYSHLWFLPGYVYTKSAKLCLTCSKRTHVPTYLAFLHVHVLYLLMCPLANVPCVLMCWRANVSCVLKTCSSVNVPCVLTCLSCQHILRAYVLKCQRGLRSHRLTSEYASSLRLTWPPDHLPTCFASSVSSFDATFLIFTAIAVEVVHTVGKV